MAPYNFDDGRSSQRRRVNNPNRADHAAYPQQNAAGPGMTGRISMPSAREELRKEARRAGYSGGGFVGNRDIKRNAQAASGHEEEITPRQRLFNLPETIPDSQAESDRMRAVRSSRATRQSVNSQRPHRSESVYGSAADRYDEFRGRSRESEFPRATRNGVGAGAAGTGARVAQGEAGYAQRGGSSRGSAAAGQRGVARPSVRRQDAGASYPNSRTRASVNPAANQYSSPDRYRETRRNRNQDTRRSRQENAATGAKYEAMAVGEKRKRQLPVFLQNKKLVAGAAAVIIVLAAIFGVNSYLNNCPVDVTINGKPATIEGSARSIGGLLDTNTVSVTPGNYVAVDNSVMRQGEGTRCTAVLNGENEEDLSTHLNAGDNINISNGTDIMEKYTDSNEQEIPYQLNISGQGALHVYTNQGENGIKVTRVGSESGRTVETNQKDPVNQELVYYNADTKGEKVVCLTFDDGPWDGTTKEILDILKENDAKATFFTIGNQIPNHSDLIKREQDEGHEVCTHTYDHAAGSGQGVSLNFMSTQERKDEITKGYDAIKQVTGTDVSTVVRTPGGNFNESVAQDLANIVSSEINWNIDTEDWRRPGAEKIAERIKKAAPGEVILMHDGGGDRSQTVAGLREALPYLKSEGYKFITISELIEKYPYQG